MSIRILFADDDENIINAFRRIARSRRNEYVFFFANGGKQAVDIMRETNIDFLVTDMRMPGLDGADLLEWVSDNHPHTVRFILSGEANAEQTCRIVGKSHRFFAKPCSPCQIMSAISQIYECCRVFGDETMQDTHSCWDMFGTPAHVFAELNDVLCDENADSGTLAGIVSQDPSLSIRILQIANSAYFGRAVNTCNIKRAISSIGLETLHTLNVQGRLGQGAVRDKELLTFNPSVLLTDELCRPGQQLFRNNQEPDVTKAATDLIRLSMTCNSVGDDTVQSALSLALILGLPPQVAETLSSAKQRLEERVSA